MAMTLELSDARFKDYMHVTLWRLRPVRTMVTAGMDGPILSLFKFSMLVTKLLNQFLL